MPNLPPGAITTGDQRPIDVVLEGGGVKGIGLVGALQVLADNGFVPQRIAGTSAGAITAALLAAGYGPDEMEEKLLGLPLRDFMDEGPEDRVPLIGKPISILAEKGIYEGKRLQEWMAEMLAEKNVMTFGQLKYAEVDDPRRRYRLHMIASDVTRKRMLILPQHAPDLGYENPDDMPVAEAVRMSMGIPIFFEPLKRGGSLIVDGAMLSNFPVGLFDAPPGQRLWHTFGLLLAENQPAESIADRLDPPEPDADEEPNVIEYGRSLLQTMLEAHDRRYIESDAYLRTIMIPTLGVRTTDFDLGLETKLKLLESGRKAAEKFLREWTPATFEALEAQGDAAPGRRELLQQALEP